MSPLRPAPLRPVHRPGAVPADSISRCLLRSFRGRGAAVVAAGLALASLSGCLSAILGGRPPTLGGPPSLRVDFSSSSASAHLAWQRPPLKGFVRYEVERMDGDDYTVRARLADSADTTWTDAGLLADRAYRYRVSSVYAAGEGTEEQRLPSTVVEGGIHRWANQWPVGPGLLPLRIAIGRDGVLHVVGAGAARVERFDSGGNAMGSWVFDDAPPACLETAVLDGPECALDGDGNLHVVYNARRAGQAPQALWVKLGADGNILWRRPLRTVFVRHIAIDGDRVFIESISQLQQFDTEGELIESHQVPPLMVSSIGFWRGAFAALVEPLGYDISGWQAPRLVVYASAGRGRRAVTQVYGRDPLSETDTGAGLLARPSDFAPVPLGDRVFVVNAGRDRVEVFRRGRYLTRWGETGSRAGQFRLRGVAEVVADVTGGTLTSRRVVGGGIARDADGFIYVADTFNHRIQKFAP